MTNQISGTTPSFTTIPLQAVGDSTFGNPQIQNLRMSKESQLEIIPYPSKDSNYVIAYDILGVVRHINIQGITQGTTTQLEAFISAIEALINGEQYNRTSPKHTVLLTLDLAGAATYNVVLKNFSWNYNAGVLSAIDWTLEAVESTTSF